MAQQIVQLHEFIPIDWTIKPFADGLRIIAPSKYAATCFKKGAKKLLREAAGRLGVIEISWDGCSSPIRIASMNQPGNNPRSVAETSSYAPARIDPDASFDEIEDFIRGAKAAGKIVTVMSMNDRDPAKNDLFLRVNDLQIQHRAGGWTIADWVGTDAKSTVWIRSFDGSLPATSLREAGWNYYKELVNLLRSGERFIPGFEYLIDRPNQAGLWLDVTDYHFAEDYGGCAVRIAVSDPKNSTLIQAYDS